MTTPEPVSPAPSDDRDPFEVAYDADQDGRDLTGPERAALNDALQPAVSPAPDTEALRQQAARALYRADGLNGNASHDPWDERSQKVHLRYLALAENGVLPLMAGFLAELDRAHTERDKLGREVDRLTAAAHTYRESWMRVGRERDVLWDRATTAERQIERLRAGVRPIPDDAAERAALRMFRVHVYGTLTSERYDASARNQWAKVLDEDDRETWRKLARELLADLGATPTTGPAPAAADGPRWVQRGLHHHRCAVRAGAADCTCGVEPAAPQAPAEPTECNGSGVVPDWDAPTGQWNVRGEMDTNGEPPGKPCEGCPNCTPAAREDTAPPDGYNDDVRPSGPVVPLCADCNEAPATDPRLTVNGERVCVECWTEVEANGADDPEEV